MEVKVKKLNALANVFTYGSEEAAGADIYACIEDPIELKPGELVLIPTGIAMEIPKMHAGLIYARSGLSTKKGLAPGNMVGVIDSDYRGEIKVSIRNYSQETVTIEPNERIAQFIITPYLKVDYIETETLEETERGTGGFGSTGSN